VKRIARLLCVLFFVNFPFLLPAANTQKSDPEVSQAKKIEKKPKPIPIKPAPEKAKKAPTLLPPRATGIIPEGIRQGPQLINPLAPKEMGYGQRFMAKDPRQPHPTWTINSTEVMTPGGGLELFTWEW
jgi:hypothetical protein